MGINELFDELARVIDPFAEELAEQKLITDFRVILTVIQI